MNRGESDSTSFGGNSNWRGPVWMPVNYMLVEHLRRFHQFYGDWFTIECPTGSGTMMTLNQIADELCRAPDRTVPARSRRKASGVWRVREVSGGSHFKDYILFHEYFHGDNGRGCGASHQTGWTGLVANLITQLVAEPPAASAPPASTKTG